MQNLRHVVLFAAAALFINGCTEETWDSFHTHERYKSCTVMDHAGMTYTRYGEDACREAIQSCQVQVPRHQNVSGGVGCNVL
jgi:hypothetical protein